MEDLLIDLDDNVLAELQRIADERGLSVEELARSLITQAVAKYAEPAVEE